MKPDIAQDVQHNYGVSTTEGMFASVTMGMALPFLGLFAVALGSSNMVIGLITSLPALVNVLMMIPAAQFFNGYSRKLPVVFWSGLLHRLFYLPMAFIPFLPAFRGESFVVLLALMTFPQVVLNLGWTSLMSNLFPVRYRGELFGRRNMWCGTVSMLATVFAGTLLDMMPHPYNWTVLFLIAFGGAMVSNFIVLKHREPLISPPTMKKSFRIQFREMLGEEQLGRKLKVFLVTSFLFHLGLNFAAPLWAIYFGRELGLANSLIGGFTTIMGLTTVLSSIYWGKKTSLYGDEVIFAVALFGMAIWPALFGLSSDPFYMFGLHAVLGVFQAAFNLTIFNMLLSAASYEYKSASIATFHTLNSLTGIIAPFLGTFVLQYISIQQAMVVSTGLRLAGLTVFFFGSRDTLLPLLGDMFQVMKRRRYRALYGKQTVY